MADAAALTRAMPFRVLGVVQTRRCGAAAWGSKAPLQVLRRTVGQFLDFYPPHELWL